MIGACQRIFNPPSRTNRQRSRNGVHVRGLSKRFRHVQALEAVSLDVRPGQIVALLGPNGAGKSTLLRILSTLVTADAGEVRVSGWDPARNPREVQRAIGLVLPDDRSWAWRLTGHQNLEFFAALLRIRSGEARQRVTNVVELVGMTDHLDRRFDEYSAGMRARLALARAMLSDPRVLLLDEPTRSLDPVGAAQFRDVLRETTRSNRASVLLVTHDLREAAELGDAAVLLHRGRVEWRLEAPLQAGQLDSAYRTCVSS